MDEIARAQSGLSERPHRCRTWAPRGQTPVLQYQFRWTSLSAIAGVTWWRFHFRLFRGAIRGPQAVVFLAHLRRHLPGKLLVIWDGLRVHRSRVVQDFVAATGDDIVLAQLPAYAPELNPVEYLWGHWKQRRWCARLWRPFSWLNDGVDRVRLAEHRELLARSDTRLTGTKYRWLRNPEHFDPAVWRAFGLLRRSTLEVARAWALKEAAARLWEYRYVGAARTFFRRWYHWATRSRLQPMIEKARMLKTYPPNILTYLTRRITNATAEGLNSKIWWALRGFVWVS